MRRVFTFIALTVLAVLPMLALRIWRVRAANEAAAYAPTYVRYHAVPSGTNIRAIIIGGIAESAAVGDPVVAVVTQPIMVDGDVAIPLGAQLKGALERVPTDDTTGARVRLRTLELGNRIVAIDAESTIATAEIHSEAEALGAGLKALVSGSIGAALAAATGDKSLIHRGVLEGARLLEPDMTGIPITARLTHGITV